MTTDAPLMPDFTDALEARLRGAAERPRRRLARRGPRFALATAAVAAAVALAVVATTDRHGPVAYGKPLILATPAVAADDVIDRLEHGLTAMVVFGDHLRLTEARPVPAFGGTAYVVTGPDGWCLTAPDPAADHPQEESGVTCMRTPDVYAYGIALGIGTNVVAALPQGAKDPTVRLPDGTARDLQPSDQGVVVAENLPPGSVLVLYAADGSERTTRL